MIIVLLLFGKVFIAVYPSVMMVLGMSIINFVGVFFVEDIKYLLWNVFTYARPVLNLVVFIGAFNLARFIEYAEFKRLVLSVVVLSLLFIFLQFLGVIDEYSIWTDRKLFNYYKGLQFGAEFIYSYSFGAFLLLILFSDIISNSMFWRFLIIITSFFTQSKSVLLGLIYFIRKHLFSAGIFLIGVFVLLEDFVMKSNYGKFLNSIVEGRVDSSTSNRLTQIKKISNSLERNFMFGSPDRDYFIENWFGHYIYTYGVVGALLLGSIIFFLWRICVLIKNKKMFYLILILGLSFPVIDAPKIGYFLWFYLGTLLSMKVKDETISYTRY